MIQEKHCIQQRTPDGTVELLQRALFYPAYTHSLQPDLLSTSFSLAVHLI